MERPISVIQWDVHQIKLKKDYIPGWGDSADLAVVGGRYDATEAATLGDRRLSWTTFYLACLTNEGALTQPDVKPKFRVVGTVGRPCLRIADLHHLNEHGKLCQVPFGLCTAGMDIELSMPPSKWPTVLFTDPVVVEVVGAGFDRPPNERFLTLRFPRILKVHRDRTHTDCIDFGEYQRQAEQSTTYLVQTTEQGRFKSADELAIVKSGQLTYGSASRAVRGGGFCGPDPGTSTELNSESRVTHKEDASHGPSRKRTRSTEPHSGPGTLCKKPRKETVRKKDKVNSRNLITGPSSRSGVVLRNMKDQQDEDCEPRSIPHIDLPNRTTESLEHYTSRISDRSRVMIPYVPSPLLCDQSLWALFADPSTDLLGTCCRCPGEITSNTDVFLDGVTRQMTIKTAATGQNLIPFLVLVHWPSASDVLHGMKSWLSVLEGHESFLWQPGACEITFLDWEALEAFGNPSQDISHIIERFSRGSITCIDQ